VPRADNVTIFICCLEILEPHPPGSLEGMSRPVMGFLYVFFASPLRANSAHGKFLRK